MQWHGISASLFYKEAVKRINSLDFILKNPSLEKTLRWKCHLKKKEASYHDMQFRLIKQTGGNVVVVNQRKVVCRRRGLFKMSMDERPPNKLEAA